MPAPVSPASRMPWNGAAAEPPPPPAPSLLESIPAAYRATKDTILWEQEGRLTEAYKPIIDALNERAGPRPFGASNPYYRNVGAGRASAMQIDRDRVWADIVRIRERDPMAFPQVPQTRQDFEQGILTRYGGMQADQQTAARGGIVPQFIGGLAATATDPVNLGIGIATGGLSTGTTLLRGMLIDGVVNAASELAQTPANIEARRRVGQETTAGDVAMSLGEAFVFGAGLRGVMEGSRIGFEKAIAANWERLPEGLRTRWTARTTLDPAGEDKLLADMAEALIGPERMTEAEAGAAAELRRQAEISTGNPFMANGAGTAAHLDALAARMAAIIHDTPSEKPAFVPGQRLGGMGDTALGTGTVAGDAQSRFMAKTRVAESSGNDAAQAATSSAFGRYQFTKGTWLGYYVRRFGTNGLTREQIYAKRADPNLQDVLMADLTADNAARLSGMGAPVTEGNLYLMHLLGPTDAEKVLRAGPDTPLEGLINKASIAANRSIMAGKTAADIRAFAARKMGSAGDGGAGLHLNPALDAEAGLRAQMDAELAAVRAEAERLDAELRGRGVDTEALIREAEAADMRDAQPVPVEDIGPDALPRPLAEPRAPLERPIVPNAPAETLAIADKLKPLINDRARDINDLAGIAAELGVTPEEVRSGLLLLARDKTLVTVRKKDGAFIRRNVPSRDLSLIEWIKQGGGIYDGGIGEFKGGDLAAMGLNDWYKGGPFRDKKPIINDSDWARQNRGLDKVLREAVVQGYFPELQSKLIQSGPDELHPNELLKALDQELRGHATRYPVGSRSYEKTARLDGAPAPAPRGDNPYGWDAVLADTFDDLRIAAEGLGMDASLIDQDMVFYAADLRQMNPQMEPGDLFSRVINDIAEANRWDAVDESGDVGYEELDYAWPYTSENPEPRSQAGAAAPDRGGPESIGSDPRTGGPNGGADGANGQGTPPDLADMPPEEATRFLDPTGDAAKTQIDTLEHDALMAMRAAQTAAESQLAYNRMYVSPQTGEEAARLLWDAQATPEELAQFAAGWEAGKRGDARPANEDTTFFEGWFVGNRTKTLLAEGVQPMPREGEIGPRTIETAKSQKLADQAPIMWRETNLKRAEEFLPGATVSSLGVGGDPYVYLADTRGMAIGQGANTGVMLEFDTANLTGKINKKAGWQFQYMERQGSEFIADNPGKAYQDALRSIELSKDAMAEAERLSAAVDYAGTGRASGMLRALNELEAAGWTKATTDTGVKYTRPEAKPTLDNGAAVDPNIRAKTRQEADIAAQQPLTGARKTGKAQDPVMPEGLFGGPVEPTFDLGDGGPPKTMNDLLAELDADEADNATIRSCMVPKPGAGE